MIEVTLALGVAAVSMLAIFGLLATGSQVNHTAVEQTTSTDLITAVASDLRATPLTTPRGQATTSPQYGLGIPTNPVTAAAVSTLYFDSAGRFATSATSSSRYRLAVTFLPNGNAKTATFVNLRMTWPALADPAAATTEAAETFIALDRN